MERLEEVVESDSKDVTWEELQKLLAIRTEEVDAYIIKDNNE